MCKGFAAETSETNDEDDSKWPHNYCISRADVPHFEKVYSNLQQQLKRKPEDKLEDLDVNTLMWRMFVIVTQQPAVLLWIIWKIHIQSKISHNKQ